MKIVWIGLTVVANTSGNLKTSVTREVVVRKANVVSMSEARGPRLTGLTTRGRIFFTRCFYGLSSPSRLRSTFDRLATLLRRGRPRALCMFGGTKIVSPVKATKGLSRTTLVRGTRIGLVTPVVVSGVLLHRISDRVAVIGVASNTTREPVRK